MYVIAGTANTLFQ